MKLTSKDKEILTEWGYREQDFNQIERAITKTKYELLGFNDKRITLKEALQILGREEFLSGVSRSAFHWTAVRENEKGQKVHFNSSKLFK